MSRNNAIILGVLMLWPIIYVLALLNFMVTGSFFPLSFIMPAGDMAAQLKVLLPVHIVTMLEILGLLIVLLVQLSGREDFGDRKRRRWVFGLLSFNIFAMPIFWYLYVWKNPAPQSAGQRKP